MDEFFPNVYTSKDTYNPCIHSPSCEYDIYFYQTSETLLDPEVYKRFLENAISRFRKSKTYKHYKGYLVNDLGLNTCQVLGNVTNDMATIEMHHYPLTIFDVAVIICNHVLRTRGYITTYDLVSLLKQAHTNNLVGLVMLALTPHQLYHNAENVHIDPRSVFGDFYTFLKIYYRGLTLDIAYKLYYFFNDALACSGTDYNELLNIRDQVFNWAQYNQNN